jgi:hypothetical protein
VHHTSVGADVMTARVGRSDIKVVK